MKPWDDRSDGYGANRPSRYRDPLAPRRQRRDGLIIAAIVWVSAWVILAALVVKLWPL